LKTPDSTLAFNTETGATQLLKQAQVDGSFNPDHYTTEYHTFSASDGAAVPISLVYNHTLKRKPRPAYLYAYGSYGYSTEPYFRSSSLSLLDRGFVFAIIHVRGGQELGRQWYEQGRLQQKKNTFTDFIEGSRYLASTGLADPDNLFAAGGSAGGLLMGVIANEAPEVYQGIIAKVPFVDVVTTMLDDSIPLTTSEYREWGDPKIKEDFDYMLSYSPYDQVKAQGYPNMLVTTGLHDSQVQYFEPAKWVARLRRLKTDENHLILDTDMASGHSGPSGRYERYRKTALEYAFILDHLKTTP
jgi:oligopeptidase B